MEVALINHKRNWKNWRVVILWSIISTTIQKVEIGYAIATNANDY